MITFNTIQLSLISACLFAPAHMSHGDTVTLKSSIRMTAGVDTVKLADIADLDGPDANRLADLAVLQIKNANAVSEISVQEVRSKLDEAGVNWGRINLSGRKVVVRPNRGANAGPPLAMSPASLDSTPPPRTKPTSRRDDRLASDIIASPMVRGMVAGLIAANLHVDPANLRLSFDHDDAEWLDKSSDSAQFEFQPLGSFASDRLEITIRSWIDGKVQQSHTITVLPLMRITAATLRRDLQPNETIDESDVESSEQWLPPSQASLTSARVNAIGRVATKNLKAGEVLREKHIRRDALIKRGDLTIVRCLVGGVAISLQAEARGDGSLGDTIEFRKQGERDTFLATVTSRGEAVVDLSKR